MQLELDEEKEIGSELMFSDSGDMHEMYVALIRYKNRRYISLSRMDRHKSKKSGEEKLRHRNSIWIPISSGKEIAELIWRAASEAERLNWNDVYDENQIADYVATLEEGEKIFRYSVSVCRDARIFLFKAKDLLSESFGLKVNVRAVAEKLSFTLPQVIRVIDYLQDAGYIKQINYLCLEDIPDSEDCTAWLSSVLKTLSAESFREKIRNRAQQLDNMTDEQVDNLDYMDDEDPRIERWEFLNRLVEAEFVKNIFSSKVPASFEISAKGYDWLEDW